VSMLSGRPLSSKGLMLTALFSAIYVSYGYVSSITIGGVTHGVDTSFVRSALFPLLVAYTLQFGYSTLMGAVSGIIFTFVILGPFPIYLLPSVLLYGLTYDLYMRTVGYSTNAKKAKHILAASAVSSIVMSLVALAILTLMGILPTSGLVFIWVFGVLRDVAMGFAGGIVGVEAIKYTVH